MIQTANLFRQRAAESTKEMINLWLFSKSLECPKEKLETLEIGIDDIELAANEIIMRPMGEGKNASEKYKSMIARLG